MKALVYHGPGRLAWEAVSDPGIEAPTDAIVRITTTTICSTDLHCGHGAYARRKAKERKARMKGKLQRAAGRIEKGATVEIVAKAEANGEATAGASLGSGSPEYTVRDEAGHEEAVDTRDFELLR